MRSRATITAPKASASSTFSQKMMRASDVPPSLAATHSAAVATGPYTDTVFFQVDGISPNGICLPTGSPVCSSCRGVMTYGLCPVTAIRPLAAYDMESVEPAAGSTVNTTTARNANAMSARAGGRAPRATATRPAITPAPPSTMAAHNPAVTNVVVRCRECHHGGPLAGRTTDGTVALGPAAEITIMTSVDATIAAAASPASRAS